MDNLTQQLNESQLKENITALQKAGVANEKIQTYVDNYSKGTDGNYILKSPNSPEKPTILDGASDLITKIFPGKQLGNALGNSVSGIYQAIKQKSWKPIEEAGQENNRNFGKIVGDTANILGTVAAPLVGGGPTVGGRILANTALGTGLGAANSLSQGKDASGVATDAALGGLVGGGLSAATEGVSALINNLPKWFTQIALPKMKNAPEFKYIPNEAGGFTRTPQESAAEYAINNTKGLSAKSMLSHSRDSIGGYSNQIDNILAHPEYATETGASDQIITSVMDQFPNAQLSEKKVINILKQLAPENKSLVEKVAQGQANLAEQNALRSELDSKIYVKFPEKTLTFGQTIGKAIADSLRGSVQQTAPETAPIFNKLSKEFNLNQALVKAVNKKTVAGDILSGAAGFYKGGLPGAAEAILLERGIRSPTVLLNAAKILKTVGKVATPVGKALLQGGKAPLIKAVTENQK